MKHIRNILLLLIIGYISFGYGVGKHDLWAPDEPRFGQAVREMIQRRDPFVLHVNNEPYSDKPPLHIWIAAAIELAKGHDGSTIDSSSVRAPSVLGGLISLIATYFLALALFRSPRIALLSGIILATSLLHFYQASRAQLDMLMCGWCSVALMAFVLAHKSEEGPRRIAWWSLFWIAGGLGTLSKGPPAVIVALGTAVFFLLWQRDAKRAFQTALAWTFTILTLTLLAGIPAIQQGATLLILLALAVPTLIGWSFWRWLAPLWRESPKHLLRKTALFLLGIVLFFIVVGVWFIPYRLNAPRDSSSDTLVTQTLVRYFVGISHVEPVWYYLKNIPHNLLPWTFFLLFAAIQAWRRGDNSKPMLDEPRRFLTTWILFTLIFFSLSPGKRDQYLLPFMPAFAILGGWFFDRLVRLPREALGRSLTLPAYFNIFIAVALIILGFGLQFLFVWTDVPTAGWRADILAKDELARIDLQGFHAWILGLVGMALAAFLFLSTRRRYVWGVFAGSALLAGSINFYLNNVAFPQINPLKSGRYFSEELKKWRTDPQSEVGIYDFFRAEYMVDGDYFLKRIDKNESEGDPDLHAFLKRPERVFLILREDKHVELLKLYPDLPIRFLFNFKVGHRELSIIDNKPQPKEASRL